MPRKCHADEQIFAALQQSEGGETKSAICRKLRISQDSDDEPSQRASFKERARYRRSPGSPDRLGR